MSKVLLKNTKDIQLGPIILSKNKWRKTKQSIRTAFDEWKGWAGNKEDPEEYKKFVDKELAKIEAILKSLESNNHDRL